MPTAGGSAPDASMITSGTEIARGPDDDAMSVAAETAVELSDEVRVLQWRISHLAAKLDGDVLSAVTRHGVRRQLAVQQAMLARELRRQLEAPENEITADVVSAGAGSGLSGGSASL